jgi:hypothetical protein
MRFSEQHEVKRPEGSDWFDSNVEMDGGQYRHVLGERHRGHPAGVAGQRLAQAARPTS